MKSDIKGGNRVKTKKGVKSEVAELKISLVGNTKKNEVSHLTRLKGSTSA